MKMRWLVDLNIVLDVLLDRPPHAEAAAILWASAERGEVELLIAAHAVTTLHDLAQRGRGQAFAYRCVADVMGIFGVAAVDEQVLQRAVALAWPDFEDAVVAAAAVASGCSAIVTRDPRGFAKAALPVLDAASAAALITQARPEV